MTSALNEALIYLRKPIENVRIPMFIKRAEAYVNVCHIISPNEFYIRLEANTPFVNELDKIPRDNLAKPTVIDVGSLVLYESKIERSKLLRGIVIRNEIEQKYDMKAIDIGFEEYEIAVEKIWDCDIKFPALAYSCQLDACKSLKGDDIWHDFCIQGFKSLLKGSMKMVYVTNIGNQLVVQILVVNQMVSELMVMCGWAMMTPSHYK